MAPRWNNKTPIFFRHSNNIVVAIKSNNNETNPKHNPTLAKAIADAQYEDVPKVSNQISINKSLDDKKTAT